MTRLPSPVHRAYRRASRSYGPWSVEGLVAEWPIDGPMAQDSAGLTPAGAGDPVGRRRDVTPSGLDLLQATTSKKPTHSASGPGLAHDMLDDLMQATYALSMSSRWAIALAVWARDDSDRFEVEALGVTNLDAAGEVGVRVEDGDQLQVPMPANWDPDSWAIAAWFKPDWASTDGLQHDVFFAQVPAGTEFVQVTKLSGDRLFAQARMNGVTKTVELSKAFAAGSAVFVGARLDGGTLTIYADTNGDGTLETASVSGVPASTSAGSWTAFPGNQTGVVNRLNGALNLLVTTGASSSYVSDRFGSGSGMRLDEWLGNQWAEALVLGVHGSLSGELEMISFQGASQLVTNTGLETDATNWSGQIANVSQSPAQAFSGTKSLLVDPTASGGGAMPNLTTITQGRWYYATCAVYPVSSGGCEMRYWANEVGTWSVSADTADTWTVLRAAVRASGSNTENIAQIRRSPSSAQPSGDFYLDEHFIYELAVLTPSTATKAVPSRVIASFSKAGLNQPYVYAGVATDEKLEIGARDDAGGRIEASSAGALAIGPHSLILEFDGTVLKAFVDTVEVASLAVAGALTGLDTLTLGGLAGFVEGHPFDERIGGAWLHAGAAFRGYTAIDRRRLHNYLASKHALAQVP